MTEREKSVLLSLDGEDYRIFPYLTYLLQDLWDIGTSPSVISSLIIKNKLHKENELKIIDLGCGKGAVAVTLAKEFGFRVHGFDGHNDFIREANEYAKQYEVDSLCTFEVGDIREEIASLTNYDLLILGSIGPVLGPLNKTLSLAGKVIREGGYIILDEGYYKDEVTPVSDEKDYTREAVLSMIENSGVTIIDQHITPEANVKEKNSFMFSCIRKRAEELSNQYPEKGPLFDQYVKKQQEENRLLEEKFECVTWVLKKNAESPRLLL